MLTNYQVILMGNRHILRESLIKQLFVRVAELGLSKEALIIIDADNFSALYKANAPAVCLYFGSSTGNFKDMEVLERLYQDANLIVPVVTDIKAFVSSIPNIISSINGFELLSNKGVVSTSQIEKLVSCVLENLGLLRRTRKLFISYKRDESSAVALQLFEQLEKQGFDVFLDTHSIRPGDAFQEELWHRLADSDVVVLLNTPGFLTSKWTEKELAKANLMLIGVFQLIWPAHKLERNAELSMPYQLAEGHFGNKLFKQSTRFLTDQTIDEVVRKIESLRARSLASRQDNLITEFMNSANKNRIKVVLQPQRFLSVEGRGHKKFIVIPAIGVPQAFNFYQSGELMSCFKQTGGDSIYLLYDHRNIREKWLKHLAWLDRFLPVKSIKIIDVDKWLKKI